MPHSRPSLHKITLLTALAITLLISACVKDPEPTGGTGGTGEPQTSITFIALQNDSVFLPDVFIGITPNQGDRDNGIFLFSGTSNPVGEVEFTELLPITYYFSASLPTPNGPVIKEGSITLEEGDEVEREIKF